MTEALEQQVVLSNTYVRSVSDTARKVKRLLEL